MASMHSISRRAALIGVAASAVATSLPARAAMPSALVAHPGFRPWTPSLRAGGLPLQEIVETEAGPKRLVDWLDHRPAVVAMWASWCAPCLIEKPHQAAMGRRLAASGASARILALQTYDDGVDFEYGRALLDRIGARGLPSARATPPAEDILRRMFGATRANGSQTTLPTVLLIGADGLEIGRAIGTMTAPDGESDYWQDEATFDFLSRLL
jgi:thiol-disulfide isomerase/thioredoxin